MKKKKKSAGKEELSDGIVDDDIIIISKKTEYSKDVASNNKDDDSSRDKFDNNDEAVDNFFDDNNNKVILRDNSNYSNEIEIELDICDKRNLIINEISECVLCKKIKSHKGNYLCHPKINLSLLLNNNIVKNKKVYIKKQNCNLKYINDEKAMNDTIEIRIIDYPIFNNLFCIISEGESSIYCFNHILDIYDKSPVKDPILNTNYIHPLKFKLINTNLILDIRNLYMVNVNLFRHNNIKNIFLDDNKLHNIIECIYFRYLTNKGNVLAIYETIRFMCMYEDLDLFRIKIPTCTALLVKKYLYNITKHKKNDGWLKFVDNIEGVFEFIRDSIGSFQACFESCVNSWYKIKFFITQLEYCCNNSIIPIINGSVITINTINIVIFNFTKLIKILVKIINCDVYFFQNQVNINQLMLPNKYYEISLLILKNNNIFMNNIVNNIKKHLIEYNIKPGFTKISCTLCGKFGHSIRECTNNIYVSCEKCGLNNHSTEKCNKVCSMCNSNHLHNYIECKGKNKYLKFDKNNNGYKFKYNEENYFKNNNKYNNNNKKFKNRNNNRNNNRFNNNNKKDFKNQFFKKRYGFKNKNKNYRKKYNKKFNYKKRKFNYYNNNNNNNYNNNNYDNNNNSSIYSYEDSIYSEGNVSNKLHFSTNSFNKKNSLNNFKKFFSKDIDSNIKIENSKKF